MTPPGSSPDPIAVAGAALRLIEGLVCNLQHDLRQPLAAIGLAAHNGRRLIDLGQSERASAKFDLIIDQIATCDSHLTARSAGFEAGRPPLAQSFADLVRTAIARIRPRLADAAILLSVGAFRSSARIRADGATFDLLIALAMLRAIESVGADAAGQAAVVEVVVSESDAEVSVTIHHNREMPEDAADTLVAAVMRNAVAGIGGRIVFDNGTRGWSALGFHYRRDA